MSYDGLNKTEVPSTTQVPTSSAHMRSDGTRLDYLLYLEIMRRAKEDEAKLRRLLDDKRRQFEETRRNYTAAYAKIVEIIKLSATRVVLEEAHVLDESKLKEAKQEAEHIIDKIRPDELSEVLDEQQLDVFKRLVNSFEVHEKPSGLITERCLDTVQTPFEELVNGLQNLTMQAINYNAQKMHVPDIVEDEV